MKRRNFFKLLLAGASIAVCNVKEAGVKVVQNFGFMKKGDKFTVEGWYTVDPVTKEFTDKLQEFTVIDDTTARPVNDKGEYRDHINPGGI